MLDGATKGNNNKQVTLSEFGRLDMKRAASINEE